MLLKEMYKSIVVILVLLLFSATYAQPRHDRLLYHVPLTSNDQNPIGEITAVNGDFTANGWTPDHVSGQIRIDLNSFLPFEGTLKVTLSGMMPGIDNEWIPIALYSRGDGSFEEVDRSPGSYIFLKGDDHYAQYDIDFKLWSAAFYGYNINTKREESNIAKRTWSRTKDYVFQITWNREMVYFLLDGQVLAQQPFEGQVESFGYIFLGRDNTYPTTPGGVYYKDLKIYAGETEYPFSNIADPYEEMGHRKIGGQGVVISDVDNNGQEDIYVSRFYNSGYDVPNLLYVRNNGSFSEEGELRGVDDPSYSYQSLVGDFDSDGDNDVFVVNFHRSPDWSNAPNHLYINDGSGNFIDQSNNLSGNTAADSKGATMLDIENDGDLDLVVVNSKDQHQVYVNNGSARFNVETRGLESFRSSARNYKDVTSGDLNKDGFQDLVITHDSGLSIAKNNGAGTFIPSIELAVPTSANTTTLADIDGDADLDILVGVHADNNGRVEIFRNDGNFSFVNISSIQTIATNTFGLLSGDWDNDGDVDLFAIDKETTGKLYTNNGDGKFFEQAHTGVEANFISGRGAATLDANDDGRLDIYATAQGGTVPDDDTREEKRYNRFYLFKNEIVNPGNFLKIKIVNDQNAVTGIGNKLYVYQSGQLDDPAGLLGYREIMATSAFLSQSSLIQHFGVGSASVVDVKIELPDGQQKVYTNVPTNQTMVVRPVQIVPIRMERDFDDNQTAIVGQPYELAYKLFSAENEPAPDHPVTFEIVQGNGSLDPSANVTSKTVNTNQEGVAAVSWFLGPLSGPDGVNQIRVTSSYDGAALSGSPDNFSVIADPGNPEEILKADGDDQMGFINTELPNELVARVVDEFGNGIASHPVEFTIAQGGGALTDGNSSATQITVNTDNGGNARIRWILGSQLGQQKVYARATQNGVPLTNSPLTFTATAQQPQRQLLYSSGDNQSAPVNSRLPDPFVVRLLDADNVPVSGHDVKFVVVNEGSFSGSDSVFAATDNQGYARATATLGSTVGDSIYVFQAFADNAVGSPVTFKASATSGPPANIVIVDGNNQSAPAGRYVPNPLQVKVTDAEDYPVNGHDVQFNVTEGNGLVDGAETTTVKTNAQGIASVDWKLGETVGTNRVVATATGLSSPGVNFKADGVVGPAARLAIYSGDKQKGEAGQPLSQYFVVSVTDSFYNAVANHAVTFAVISGGGNLNGRSQVTEYTNAFGQAQVLLTMGPTDYEQTVQATSSNNGTPLIGSPQTFYAYLGPGDPETLSEVSGNYQFGAVNQELPEPFVVKVEDENGVGVSNIEVEFITFSQGASFAGSPSIKVRTDDDGLAKATATLGSNFGNNNYVFEAIAKFDGKHLKGSPRQFYASGRRSLAKKIQKVDAQDTYVGTVGQFLSDSLKVLVLDQDNMPVSNHPVTFQIQEGLALIEGMYTNHIVESNMNGVAAVRIKLGTRPGTSKIRATSDDGVNPLTPAYLDFQTLAEIGLPSPNTSTITAATGLVADGQSVSDVEIVLLDEFRNPIAGKYVMLQTAGIEVLVNQPSQPTNDQGVATGSITSINTGTATVWALVDDQPLISTDIEFIPGAPELVMKRNDGQTGEKGKTLPQPVGVIVQDVYGHPVSNLSVHFSVKRGKGSVVEEQPVLTDDEGKVMVHWTLGDSLGRQKLRATIDQIAEPVEFSAFAIPPSDGIVKILSGDSLIGIVNQPLPEPFSVRVTDKDDNPISNIPVDFQLVTQGGGSWPNGARINTDQNGVASAQLNAGSQVGLHQVIATATNYGSVIFNFMIENERTVRIIKLSDEGQTVRPKAELPMSIRVLDSYNRPIEAESINFNQVQGQSYIKENLPLETDADGELTATWVMGTSGAQQMEIEAVNAANQATFYTAVVVNGKPYFDPPLKKNHTINAGDELSFFVNAVDPDDDPIYYMAKNLPDSAEFDGEDTHRFAWTPAQSQAGEHHMTFIVMDEFGASDSTVVNVIVDIINQNPTIVSFAPLDTVQIIPFGTQLTFQVTATDPNGDILNYEWMVNDAFAGDSHVLPLVFTRATFPDSFATVKVKVYDNYGGESTKKWHVHMQKTTAVELANFEAIAENNSVHLQWKTAKEEGTAGFYILKSRSADGPFKELNKEIIKPQAAGHYALVDQDVHAGQRYFYKLKEIDIYGMSAEHGMVEAKIALPTELALAQNYPNPFNPMTTIQFELPAAHKLVIAIFNTTGQHVRTLVDGEYVAGIHKVVWDATNDQGLKVPSGIYYYRMATDGFNQTKKLLLLK
mgnify:CR=1 FL=1